MGGSSEPIVGDVGGATGAKALWQYELMFSGRQRGLWQSRTRERAGEEVTGGQGPGLTGSNRTMS